uniref:Uncharacterized protein n=1 Tax=Rhizophora mucronata TaxID=61149 RepID=A0A2P2N5Z6_RHIMU
MIFYEAKCDATGKHCCFGARLKEIKITLS